MKTIATIFFLMISLNLFCQNTIGLPGIINYPKQTYSGGTQNWDIKQDRNQLLYFANNEGLLIFDGTYWKLHALPNKSIVRAIEIAGDKRIYTGGQNELGYFVPDQKGCLIYHSLVGLIPSQHRSFDDVWNICSYGNDIFFRTNKRIFQLSNHKITVYPTRSEWRFLGSCNNQLIAEDMENGVFQFENGTWIPFLKNTVLSPTSLITSFISLDPGRSLITTLNDGLFIYEDKKLSRVSSPGLDKLSSKNIYKAVVVGKNRIAIATSFGGCHIINEKGQLIQSLTQLEGLQNDNIRSIFSDHERNIWLGLDNGIDFIAYNNSIKHIFPKAKDIGSGYSALLFKDQLYFGTSTGLFKVKLDSATNFSFIKSDLDFIKNTEGEVRNLSTVNDLLLMGHHNGAFLVESNNVVPLEKSNGFWTFLPMTHIQPAPVMVAGNYKGLSFFDFDTKSFKKNKLEVLFESARFVVVENEQTIWVAHPYKGIFRITVKPGSPISIKQYKQDNGLLSINNNYIFKIKNRIVAATEKGLYEYNEQSDIFEPSAYFKSMLDEKNIRYLKEDPAGNIWFIHQKELGVVDLSTGTPKKIYFPELYNKLIGGFENIYTINQHNVIVGGEKGFYHIDFDSYKQNRSTFETQIRLIKAIGKTDSVLSGGYTDQAKAQLPFNMNSLHFEYAAIHYGERSNIEYSYYLKGFDKGWSAWSGKSEKDYTNLPAGNYTFQVKSRNNIASEPVINSFSITILPPWYQTKLAFVIYAILLIGIGYLMHTYQRKRFIRQKEEFEKQQKQLQYLHQLEIEKNEKEIVKLSNQKLEAEIEHKNSELATSAMHLVQKREMLGKLRDDLNSLLKKIDNEQVSHEFKKLLKLLVEDDKADDKWEHFAHHFDKVHTDFLVVLKNRYPGLTASELRLCAYLRMNLSNKEIAQLINISVRGVEIARYRLRKKLGISKEINLFEFLLKEQVSELSYMKSNG